MASWPSTLPAPQVSGFGLNPVAPMVRTDMEMGAARSRRRTTARNDKLAVSWQLSDAQMATFRTWFDDAAQNAGGASWFTVSLPIGTTGLQSMEARFTGPFKASMMGVLVWNVSAELEVR